MKAHTQPKKLFAVVLISLTTFTVVGRAAGTGQSHEGRADRAILPNASAPSQMEQHAFLPASGVESLAVGRFAKKATNSRAVTPDSVLFLPAVTYSAGGLFARSLAAADVNRDGKLDVVVANLDSNNVGVLLGNGDGTFQLAVTYDSGGVSPRSVAVADVNRDGKPDLVVANCGGGCVSGTELAVVSVLLGNCDGTFQPAVAYGSGGYVAASVAVGDVNGDGKPDLLVANQCASSVNCGNGTVAVLLGNGDGTFQPATAYDSGGSDTLSVAVGDVNADGKPDLLVANFVHTVSVLLGKGDGTFQPAAAYDSGGLNAVSVAVADVNGDGKLDLLVDNEYASPCCANGVVGVLLGNGDGTFQTAVTYNSGGLLAEGITVADVNGDNKLDLIVANNCLDTDCPNSGGALGVLLGNGDGTFEEAATYRSGGVDAYSVAVGDLNADSRPDLLVANCGSSVGCADGGIVAVLLNNTPFCTAPPVITLSTTPTSLWPPNGRMVPVTVSGTITNTGCTVTTPAYAVTDEYGQIQPSGAITLDSAGNYSFIVLLQASRLGTDLDGRQYTITVRASDNAGNPGSASAIVTVPHDQRR